ncbi:MAG: hypothetical protein M9898_14970 [Chitinophagaceae bacterium]|nr:hypothetical protein [Chitinophagaceae bacterium]
MNRIDKEEILRLYYHNSKHGHYQRLPDFILNELGVVDKPSLNRYELERFKFISKFIDFKGRKVLDIGGNQGYFLFRAIENGAERSTLIEGNAEHARLVSLISSYFNLPILVINEYFSFKDSNIKSDITFLLNVLHHVGDDYGLSATVENARNQILNSLNNMANNTNHLAFQLGYCWKGNRNLPLFERGTKAEMIDFIEKGTRGIWHIEAIGIAEKDAKFVKYQLPNVDNLDRRDDWGEFLNRPIFILKRI